MKAGSALAPCLHPVLVAEQPMHVAYMRRQWRPVSSCNAVCSASLAVRQVDGVSRSLAKCHAASASQCPPAEAHWDCRHGPAFAEMWP